MTSLSNTQVAQFEEQGYLVVENFFDPQKDLAPIIEEYKGVLARLVEELYAQGEISSTYAELPFGKRLTQIYAESGKVHSQYFDFCLPYPHIQEDTPLWVGPSVFHVICNTRLLDAVESLIGPEIYSNPVQHVRIKPPEHLAPKDPETGQVQAGVGATPWHQDNGVVMPEADDTQMLTVWFPLLDATVENGCLAVVPYSHRQGLLQHCPGRTGLHIPEQFFAKGDMKPLPLRQGGVIFMHRRTCHGSLANNSNDIRWSFDLRYHPIGQPTGRDALPGFVARSRANPQTELHDAEAWANLWYQARNRLARQKVHPSLTRWSADNPACA